MLLTFILFFSCKSNGQQKKEYKKNVIEILENLKENDTIDFLDLSNCGLKKIPDISHLKVRKLDISNNFLDSLSINKLPNYLTILDASNNNISNNLNFVYVQNENKTLKNNISKHLKEINLSYNQINRISFFMYDTNIDRIILSNNNLEKLNLYFNGKKISYLDVSNNINFSNIVSFNPEKIDKIKSKKIANNKKLKLIKLEIDMEDK